MQGDGDDAVIVFDGRFSVGHTHGSLRPCEGNVDEKRRKKGVGDFQYEIDEKVKKEESVVIFL
jgi:hypothetical protein